MWFVLLTLSSLLLVLLQFCLALPLMHNTGSLVGYRGACYRAQHTGQGRNEHGSTYAGKRYVRTVFVQCSPSFLRIERVTFPLGPLPAAAQGTGYRGAAPNAGVCVAAIGTKNERRS